MFKIDPQGKHPEKPHFQIIAMIGVLPSWAAEAGYRRVANAVDTLELNYGFGPLMEMKGGTLDPATGAYDYPGDPTLWPVASLDVGDEHVYFYDHAMVCVVSKTNETFMTRMD